MSAARKPHPEDSLESKLPTYVVKASEDFPGWLVVNCPREDCEGEGRPFVVHTNWRKEQRTTFKDTVLFARPCPYCWRSAKMPPRRGTRK
jgi:hypothetical protein